MNTKLKKSLYGTLKIIWIVIGVSILLITSLFYINMLNNLGVVAWVIRFSLGIYSFVVYAGGTLLFFIIKQLIKKFKKKK